MRKAKDLTLLRLYGRDPVPSLSKSIWPSRMHAGQWAVGQGDGSSGRNRVLGTRQKCLGKWRGSPRFPW
eukprot:1606471-Prymnesium_polylepis.1